MESLVCLLTSGMCQTCAQLSFKRPMHSRRPADQTVNAPETSMGLKRGPHWLSHYAYTFTRSHLYTMQLRLKMGMMVRECMPVTPMWVHKVQVVLCSGLVSNGR